MKKIIALSIVASALAGVGTLAGFTSPKAPVVTSNEATTFRVDPGHSSVMFRIVHLGVAPFYGRFNEISGDFTLEDGGSVNVKVNAASVDTNSDQRDGHLKSADFFNVNQFPEITFESTKVTESGENTYDVEGNLTMLGTSQPVSVTFTKLGEGERGRFGYRAGIETDITVKRSDYGMTFYLDNGALGDEVTLYIGLEGIRN